MSFREIPSDVAIINRALGMVSESKMISSIDDPGLNAQVARRWYKPVVSRLLEMHHWGLATKQASLVALSTNLRAGQWLNAFAPPEDMAFPAGISLASGVSSTSYYRGLAGLIGLAYGKPVFEFSNGVIYSNISGDLDYVSYDITEADFTPSFENIITLMLASRFALELPKDPELSQELAKQATTEINVAMAMDMNYGNRQYGQSTSEAELVRQSTHGYGYSWDYFPGPLG